MVLNKNLSIGTELYMLQGYMLLISLIFWVSKIPITSFTSSTTLFKRDLSTFLTFTCFSISFLPVHPESFAINYIKFNFSSPLNSHFSFFPQRFQTDHHKSVFPLALSSHFHRFPHYSVGQSCPMSTLFITIMSHCTSRHIRPPCCLTNTFCLVQLLWLLPSFSTLLCFALSQLSFSK